MTIDQITTMIINTAPDLRTNEINQLTAAIAELTEGEGSMSILQYYCNMYIGVHHMTMRQCDSLLEKVEAAIDKMWKEDR